MLYRFEEILFTKEITMAKSRETFGKKEREKKRLQKRLDKEAKRMERKSHALSGKPLQEMFVYVDENGNLTDAPPEQGQLKQTGKTGYNNSAGYPNKQFISTANNLRR